MLVLLKVNVFLSPYSVFNNFMLLKNKCDVKTYRYEIKKNNV
jgi:hypothetical protein